MILDFSGLRFLMVGLLLFGQSIAFAEGEFASVEKLNGKVLVNGKSLTKKDVVKNNDVIKVLEKSFLKLRANDGTKILIGPKSNITISLSKKKLPLRMDLGSLRWISPSKGKIYNGITTPNAVLGVRGTDFFVERDATFDETQMICFEGNVTLTSTLNKKDSKNVGPGQWGGIGGRYSKKIGEIITLKPMITQWFKDRLSE